MKDAFGPLKEVAQVPEILENPSPNPCESGGWHP